MDFLIPFHINNKNFIKYIENDKTNNEQIFNQEEYLDICNAFMQICVYLSKYSEKTYSTENLIYLGKIFNDDFVMSSSIQTSIRDIQKQVNKLYNKIPRDFRDTYTSKIFGDSAIIESMRYYNCTCKNDGLCKLIELKIILDEYAETNKKLAQRIYIDNLIIINGYELNFIDLPVRKFVNTHCDCENNIIYNIPEKILDSNFIKSICYIISQNDVLYQSKISDLLGTLPQEYLTDDVYTYVASLLK